MKDKELFKNIEKDLTISVHYTLKSSLVKKINNDAKKYKLSSSKIVNTIIEKYYENLKK